VTTEKELAPTRDGVTRGFLFADLRGYTSYLEMNGATAATELLMRYRVLVREVVGRRDGAEIRTEGDGFYVVFTSVSSAVRAGLEILEGAGVATESKPRAPIRTAIGVHAGETVDSDQGYVGAAVNIAARLCAEAAAGELLVSDTVRTLTASVLPVHFVPAGRRRLKGVPAPMVVYRVVEGRLTTPHTRLAFGRRAMIGGALAAAGVAVVAFAGLAAFLGATSSPPASSASATPSVELGLATGSSPLQTPMETPRQLVAGVLRPGTYLTHRFQPTTIFSVGDGWSVKPETPDYLAFSRTAQPDDQLTFHRVLRASSDGCYFLSQPITGPLGLYEWLNGRPELEVGTIVHSSLATVESTLSTASSDTAPTWRVDLTVARGAPCASGTGRLYVFPLTEAEPGALEESERWLSLREGDRSRILVASLESGEITMVVRTLTGADFGPFAAEVETLLSGVRFVVAPEI
jgi:class 3 adenylate cyclase